MGEYILNNLNTDVDDDTPNCTNPPNKHRDTALLDSAASLSLLTPHAKAKLAAEQEPNKSLGTPNGALMETTKTLELLLPKWPAAARRAFLVPHITNNLIAVAELCDAGCGVYFLKHDGKVDYDGGEIVTRGWRDKHNRLWRIPITSEDGSRITPATNPDEYDPKDSIVFSAEVNAIYECKNTEQLIKYFHASLLQTLPILNPVKN